MTCHRRAATSAASSWRLVGYAKTGSRRHQETRRSLPTRILSVMAIFQQPRHSCEYCAESQLTPQGNGWHDGFQDADCSRFDLVGSRGALAVAVASAVGTHLVGKRNHQTNGTHRWNLPILATLSTLRGRMVSAARIWYLSAPATSLVRPQPARVNECNGDFSPIKT